MTSLYKTTSSTNGVKNDIDKAISVLNAAISQYESGETTAEPIPLLRVALDYLKACENLLKS